MDSLLSPFELFYTLSWLMWNTDTSFCGQENVLLVMAWGTFIVWCGVAISSRAVMKEWWWVCGGELATFVVWCWCVVTSARAVIKEWWWVCDGELATFIVWCGCVSNCTGAIFIVGCVCVGVIVNWWTRKEILNFKDLFFLHILRYIVTLMDYFELEIMTIIYFWRQSPEPKVLNSQLPKKMCTLYSLPVAMRFLPLLPLQVFRYVDCSLTPLYLDHCKANSDDSRELISIVSVLVF